MKEKEVRVLNVELRTPEEEDKMIKKVNVLSQKSTDEKGFQQWQADWEDEEINDHFDEILKKELHIA